jgi:two-component system, LuxR family, response regulator FixJ
LLADANLPTFQCLIVDFHMPEMDGLDVVETLRERSLCPRTILVTGHPNAVIRARAAALGVPVVQKPFRGTELVVEPQQVVLGQTEAGGIVTSRSSCSPSP